MAARPLPRRFYERDVHVVAVELLGKVLRAGPLRARIVEVEAYHGEHDPGSHAHRGRTARNATMFGPGGHLYVYFTYGMHWCANVVCGPEGEAAAVLLRAAEPLAGLDEMRGRRPAARSDRDLLRGPARLCQGLGIDGTLDGADLVARSGRVTVLDDGIAPPSEPMTSVRIGLSDGADLPWRYVVPGSRFASGPARLNGVDPTERATRRR